VELTTSDMVAFRMMRTQEIAAILEREVNYLEKIFVEPALDGLRGEFKVVDKWPTQRRGFTMTTNLPPGVKFVGDKQRMVGMYESPQYEEGNFPEDVPEEQRIGDRTCQLHLRLSKQELEMIDYWCERKGRIYSRKPTRKEALYEFIQMQSVEVTEDVNERLDLHIVEERARLQRLNELECLYGNSCDDLKEAMELYKQAMTENLELKDKLVVERARMMEKGFYKKDEDHLLEAVEIQKRWEAAGHDYDKLYAAEFAMREEERLTKLRIFLQKKSEMELQEDVEEDYLN